MCNALKEMEFHYDEAKAFEYAGVICEKKFYFTTFNINRKNRVQR